MTHSIEEMVAICDEHAGRVERAALVLAEGAKQKSVWLDEAERLRAAAKALRDLSLLSDPNAVHANMLRGGIAKPSIRQMLHLHGRAALAIWDEADGDNRLAAAVAGAGER